MKMRLRRLTSVLLVIMMLINMFPAYADGIEQSNSTDWINYYKTKENGVPYSINPLLQHHFSKNTEESPENDGSAKVTVRLQIPFSELVQGENEIVTQLVLTKEQLGLVLLNAPTDNKVILDGTSIGTYAIGGEKNDKVIVTMDRTAVANAVVSKSSLTGSFVVDGAVYALSEKIGNLAPYLGTPTYTSEGGLTVSMTIPYAITPTEGNPWPLLDENGYIINKWDFQMSDVGIAAWKDSVTTGTLTFGDTVVGSFTVDSNGYHVVFNNNNKLLQNGSVSENGISGDLWVKGELSKDSDDTEDVYTRQMDDSKNEDGSAQVNNSCYKVSYTFKISPYAEGKVSNFAQITFRGMNFSGTVGPESYDPLYPLVVNKSSSIDYANDRILWTVIINDGYELMGESTITDKITAGTSSYLGAGADSNNWPTIKLYEKDNNNPVETINRAFANENALFAEWQIPDISATDRHTAIAKA